MNHSGLGSQNIAHALNVAVTVIALACLPLLAGADLAIAGYFYSEECRCFPANQLAGILLIDRLVLWAGRLAIPMLALSLLLIWILYRRSMQNHDRYRRMLRALSFMLALGLITPVILIHEVLKTEVGRARPRHLEQFSGSSTFTPAWVPSKACTGNCSFTSGHVAFGAWLMGAWFLGGRRRWLWFGVGALLTFLIGWLRMAQGAHFLTDVLGSALLVWLTAQLLTLTKLYRYEH